MKEIYDDGIEINWTPEEYERLKAIKVNGRRRGAAYDALMRATTRFLESELTSEDIAAIYDDLLFFDTYHFRRDRAGSRPGATKRRELERKRMASDGPTH